jgi:hypothetical protein
MCAEYKNNWVKYADDKSTSYSIDRNSIITTTSGNYYVLVLMVPYKDNIFNAKLNRSDVAYAFSEQEIDINNNLQRSITLHIYDKKGNELMSDEYSLKGSDIPPFETIVAGSVTDSLKNYVIKHVNR